MMVKPEISPGLVMLLLPEMSPALAILEGRPDISPAKAAEEIDKVKSDAQRSDWKRFIKVLLVIERYYVLLGPVR